MENPNSDDKPRRQRSAAKVISVHLPSHTLAIKFNDSASISGHERPKTPRSRLCVTPDLEICTWSCVSNKQNYAPNLQVAPVPDTRRYTFGTRTYIWDNIFPRTLSNENLSNTAKCYTTRRVPDYRTQLCWMEYRRDSINPQRERWRNRLSLCVKHTRACPKESVTESAAQDNA